VDDARSQILAMEPEYEQMEEEAKEEEQGRPHPFGHYPHHPPSHHHHHHPQGSHQAAQHPHPLAVMSTRNDGEDNEMLAIGGGDEMECPPTASSSSSSASSYFSTPNERRPFPRTPQERQQATRTPPLPSAWAVKSLLMSHPGYDPDEKEMPAIDRRRVDAAGTRQSSAHV
jgi:hypothetical protein